MPEPLSAWSTTLGSLLYASIGLVSRTSNKNFQPNNSYTHTHTHTTVFRGIKGLGKICPFIGEIIAGVGRNVTMLKFRFIRLHHRMRKLNTTKKGSYKNATKN